jgi:hypothetical protein
VLGLAVVASFLAAADRQCMRNVKKSRKKRGKEGFKKFEIKSERKKKKKSRYNLNTHLARCNHCYQNPEIGRFGLMWLPVLGVYVPSAP